MSFENTHTPFGDLAIIPLKGCEAIAAKVDYYLLQWRGMPKEHTYVVNVDLPRFGTGEGKAVLKHTARGLDVYLVVDCFNYGVTYKMYGQDVPMSPDDHYQDLKRVIGALAGKARRITVVMPMLYEGRQHRRTARESLDCATMLQELTSMGVSSFLTFDAHDPRIQNAIPLGGFDNVQPTYQMIKAMLKTIPDIKFNKDNMMIISPDEGGMSRSIYYSSVLGLELGMFYKRRNYSKIVDGRNPIEAHEFLGNDVEGKDVIIVDDMIASGDSILDIAEKLKEMKARRIYACTTFGLFTSGFDKIDKFYKDGLIDQIFTTNLIYQTDELLSKEWYTSVDMSKYIAYLVDTMNYDNSISGLLDPSVRIRNILKKYNQI